MTQPPFIGMASPSHQTRRSRPTTCPRRWRPTHSETRQHVRQGAFFTEVLRINQNCQQSSVFQAVSRLSQSATICYKGLQPASKRYTARTAWPHLAGPGPHASLHHTFATPVPSPYVPSPCCLSSTAIAHRARAFSRIASALGTQAGCLLSLSWSAPPLPPSASALRHAHEGFFSHLHQINPQLPNLLVFCSPSCVAPPAPHLHLTCTYPAPHLPEPATSVRPRSPAGAVQASTRTRTLLGARNW